MHHNAAGWDAEGRTKDTEGFDKYVRRQESIELAPGAVLMVQCLGVFHELESAAAAFVLLGADCPVAAAAFTGNSQVPVGGGT